MPLLPTQAVLAPTGMDADSDPESLEATRAQYLQNVLADRKGVLRTNIRVVNLLPTPKGAAIDAVGYYYAQDPKNDQMLYVSLGHLWYAPVTPGNPVPVPGTFVASGGMTTPFDTGVGVRFIAFGPDLICLQEDGAKPPRRYTGPENATFPSSVYPLGIAAPAASPTVTQGPPSSGTSNKTPYAAPVNAEYHYRFTYFDERFRESSLSSPATVVQYASGNDGVVSAPVWTGVDSQVIGAYLYETIPGGTTYFRVHQFDRTPPSGNWEDNLTDSAIAVMIPFADSANALRNAPPNNAKVGATFKNYLILDDVSRPGYVQVSNQGVPTQFPPSHNTPDEGGSIAIDTDQGDPVMALVVFGSLLMIFKRRGIYLLFGDTFADFVVRPVHQHGTTVTDSAVRCDNVVMVHSLDGLYNYDYQGVFLSHRVSQEVQPFFDALVKESGGQLLIEGARGAYVENKYLLFIDNFVLLYDFRAEPPGWTTLCLS